GVLLPSRRHGSQSHVPCCAVADIALLYRRGDALRRSAKHGHHRIGIYSIRGRARSEEWRIAPGACGLGRRSLSSAFRGWGTEHSAAGSGPCRKKCRRCVPTKVEASVARRFEWTFGACRVVPAPATV